MIGFISFVCIFYGIIVRTTKKRCSKNEYLTKLIIFGFFQFAAWTLFSPLLRLLASLLAEKTAGIIIFPPAGQVFYVINTLILLIFSILAGDNYDKPARYSGFLRYIIDIQKDKIVIDDTPFAVAKKDNIYTLTFYYRRNYEQNIFLRSVKDRYTIRPHFNRCANICFLSLTGKELSETLRELRLLTVKDSRYILLNGKEVFIRKEDFAYTVIIKKADLPDLPLDILEKKSQPLEDALSYYYKSLQKDDIKSWLEDFRR